MHILTYLLSVIYFFHNVAAQQSSYKAAVVEYAPRLTADSADVRLLENGKQYVDYIEQAAEQEVQIIVFPEDGLTGWENINDNTVDELSTEIPDPLQQISPCTTSKANYSKVFVDLSCAAQTHKIYVVANLIENEYDSSSNKKIYHNTNVVFDRNGYIIARYRKINLFNEDIFVPGTGTSTFKTDFGVTFGMFICFDIMFKNPAVDILSNTAVTDIVFSVAWFSQLPYLQSLSVQHGYAKTNGVNLLSAGLDDPQKKNGGSGIFLANGNIAEAYISSARTSKMIIRDVPKISQRDAASSCQNPSGPTERAFGIGIGGGQLPDISSFSTSEEDMSNYTFKSLSFNNREISDTVCSGKSNFCCSFNVVVNKNSSVESNYVYKLTAFYGARQVSLSRTLGIRNCGIVACLNDSSTSCGGRKTLPPAGLTFESITIKGTFSSKDAYDQPATLKFDLTPVSDYKYCKQEIGDNVEITMSTSEKLNSLLTFGIYGRVFSNDDKPGGQINTAQFLIANVWIVYVISIIVFLLQD